MIMITIRKNQYAEDKEGEEEKKNEQEKEKSKLREKNFCFQEEKNVEKEISGPLDLVENIG